MPRPFPPIEAIPLGEQRGQSFPRLVELMQRLLAEDGCPWDRQQTFATLRRYVVEEAHEVVDAIDGGNRDELRTELGDLIFQVVFQAELGRNEGSFGPDDVIKAIADKLVRRHPHIFLEGTAPIDDPDAVIQRWEQLKAREKPKSEGLLDSVPRGMPALLRAQRIGEKVERIGFDWPDVAGSRAKVSEEIGELDQAIAAGDKAAIEDELGDVLFALVNLARHVHIDAEAALRGTIQKFTGRFAHVEARVKQAHGGWPTGEGGEAAPLSLAELDAYWEEAKRLRKKET
jgi:tetrapyrrole methylase family protein/MazG family protein/ATP diphosphatase